MWFGIVTLLPEMFASLQSGVTGRAIRENKLEMAYWNPRDFAEGSYKKVDDRPYGGGPGMLMMAQPLQSAIQAARKASPGARSTVVYLSPQGKRFDQQAASNLHDKKNVILVAGRYEGIDERLFAHDIDEEWSIGDYVLSGGELAAMVMIDAIARLIPGVLGHEDSAAEDSLSAGLLKYPQYTRPESFQDARVPDILLSGHHEDIARWRLKQSLGSTWSKRPDLLNKLTLNEIEIALLNEFIREKEISNE